MYNAKTLLRLPNEGQGDLSTRVGVCVFRRRRWSSSGRTEACCVNHVIAFLCAVIHLAVFPAGLRRAHPGCIIRDEIRRPALAPTQRTHISGHQTVFLSVQFGR